MILKRLIRTSIFFLLLNYSLCATEHDPWLGNIYEFEVRSTIFSQNYSRIDESSHLKKKHANDLFLNASLSNSLTDLGGEFEIIQARTRQQGGDIDHLKMTGRYVWFDDLAGDPLSVVTGLSYIQAFSHSLKDVSSFHHGLYEGELFVSLGRERSFKAEMESRWWSMLGLGLAERGSPWVRFQLNYERGWKIKHAFRLFLDSMWGLGGKQLKLCDFKGYGPIAHESIDVGLRYTYLIDYYGSAMIQYYFRPYAKNFPIYTHCVLVQILCTFGL